MLSTETEKFNFEEQLNLRNSWAKGHSHTQDEGKTGEEKKKIIYIHIAI